MVLFQDIQTDGDTEKLLVINLIQDNLKRTNSDKSKILSFFFYKYFGYSIWRNFYKVNIKGLNELKETIQRSDYQNVPLVFCVNHSNWWDAALVCWLTDYLKLNAYCLMEEKQVREHKFFKRIGAIPIIREDPRQSIKTLNYAADLIRDSNKALWIFPQGEIISNEKLPLIFYNGVSYLIEKLKRVILISTHLEYRFTSEQRPEIYVNFFDKTVFENTVNINRKDFSACLVKKFEKEINIFKDLFLSKDLNDYKTILKGKISIDKRRAH